MKDFFSTYHAFKRLNDMVSLMSNMFKILWNIISGENILHSILAGFILGPLPFLEVQRGIHLLFRKQKVGSKPPVLPIHVVGFGSVRRTIGHFVADHPAVGLCTLIRTHLKYKGYHYNGLPASLEEKNRLP